MGSANSNRVTAYSDDPIGAIRPWPNTNYPAGWVAQASTISRTTYAEAFALFGTTWGSGDGSTTFTVPFADPSALPWNNPRGRLAATKLTSGNVTGVDTTGIDITGVAATITAYANRRYRITCEFNYFAASGDRTSFTASLRKGSSTVIGNQQSEISTAIYNPFTLVFEDTPGAGSVTYKLFASVAGGSSGTGTVVADANFPATIIVEDIGADLTQSPYSQGGYMVKVQNIIPNFPGANYQICTSATRPSGVTGRTIFETDTLRKNYYDGTGWICESEPWTTYVPVWKWGTTTHTPGAQDAKWRRAGHVVQVRVAMKVGSVSGTGQLFFSLPTAPFAHGAGIVQTYMVPIGYGNSITVPGGTVDTCTINYDYGSSQAFLRTTASPSAGFADNAPRTWATGDEFHLILQYEPATIHV